MNGRSISQPDSDVVISSGVTVTGMFDSLQDALTNGHNVTGEFDSFYAYPRNYTIQFLIDGNPLPDGFVGRTVSGLLPTATLCCVPVMRQQRSEHQATLCCAGQASTM